MRRLIFIVGVILSALYAFWYFFIAGSLLK